MAKPELKSWEQVERILKTYNIPKQRVRQIREALTYDAMQKSDEIIMARYLTAFGVALNEQYGFQENELGQIYQRVYDILSSVAQGSKEWQDYMIYLRDHGGIIVNFDPEWAEMEITEEELRGGDGNVV